MHEKNVRHGHISTLHIWPARRPLAASRAALIATLLPDPGDAEERKDILERMAGRVTEKVERKRVNGRMVEKVKEETTGGILHWGSARTARTWNGSAKRSAKPTVAVRPRVLDPFAGGGAIPLEAMRLGCEVTAIGHQPRCLVHPQVHPRIPAEARGSRLGPLPEFALADREFMEGVPKGEGLQGSLGCEPSSSASATAREKGSQLGESF